MNRKEQSIGRLPGIAVNFKKPKTIANLIYEGQTQEKLWALEKWKSKIRIPTFPPPRIACGARKRTAVYTELLTRPSRLHKILDAPRLLE